MNIVGERSAGNPPATFDEGEVGGASSPLLYSIALNKGILA